MATLTWADSFDHQIANITSPFATPALRFYDLGPVLANISFDTATKRTGTASLKITEDGVNQTFLGRNISSAVIVHSFYFRAAANPAAKSQFFHTNGATNNALVGVNTDGTLFFNIGGSGEVTGPNIVDSSFHLIDIKFDCSANPYTLDVTVDGSAQTQCTRATAASSMTSWRYGCNTATHNLTFWLDDGVTSVTAGDYPIGPHYVESLLPNDDSADSSYGTNVMEQGTGTDLSSSNKGYQYLDDWPPTTGINNADTVTQTTIGGSNFVEVEFPSITALTGSSSVALVIARGALQSDGTALNNGTTRVVDSSNNTLVDLYSGDMSENTAQYCHIIVPSVGGDGWTESEVNGLAVRVGMSSDVTPNPEWLAVMLEVAVLTPSSTSLTAQVLTVSPSLPVASLTHSLTAVVLTATPSLPAASLTHSLTAVTLTITPTLPQATLNQVTNIEAVTLTVTPSLPGGAVVMFKTYKPRPELRVKGPVYYGLAPRGKRKYVIRDSP